MGPKRYLAFLRELKIPALVGIACLGAFLALAPAWLPNKPHSPIEQHSVEFLQVAFLTGTAILFFAASSHTGRYRPPYLVMGYLAVAAVIAEVADGSHRLWDWTLKTHNLALIPIIIAAFILLKNIKICAFYLKILSRRASAGILATALLMNYIFTPLLGSKIFWKAVLNEQYTDQIPIILNSYLQLFTCYLIFVGATSLSLNHPIVSAAEIDNNEP